jgi:hypothetical protein
MLNNVTPMSGYIFSGWYASCDGGEKLIAGNVTNLATADCVDATNPNSLTLTLVGKVEISSTLRQVGGGDRSGTSTFLTIPNTQRQNITSITFIGTKLAPSDCYDNSQPTNVGTNTDATAYFAVLGCATDDENKQILIGQNGGVRANPSSSELFASMYSAPIITGLKEHTTNWQNVTNMSGVFSGFAQNNTSTISYTLPEFPDFFGSAATDMSSMFWNFAKGATKLETLTFSQFPKGFGSVADRMSMFTSVAEGVTSLVSLNFSDLPAGFGSRASSNSVSFANFAKDTPNGLNSSFIWHETSIGSVSGTFTGMNWGINGKILVPTQAMKTKLTTGTGIKSADRIVVIGS